MLQTISSPKNVRLAAADSDPDIYRFERRRSHRRGASGRVTAVTVLRDSHGVHNRICSLQLVDQSEGGLGVLASEPLAVDTRVTVIFQPHGPERGFDATGRVVRCRPTDHGHRIGIHLEARPAA